MSITNFMYILMLTMLAMGMIPILVLKMVEGDRYAEIRDLFLALGIALSMIVAGAGAVILIAEYARATGQLL